jgi:hypothetical protein
MPLMGTVAETGFTAFRFLFAKVFMWNQPLGLPLHRIEQAWDGKTARRGACAKRNFAG